jgi:hypothetical protein
VKWEGAGAEEEERERESSKDKQRLLCDVVVAMASMPNR